MRYFLLACMAATGWMAGLPGLHAQSVQPVISEYREHAAGSFLVTNTSGAPMAVMLEPKSFSIDLDGKGTFRALDPGIHLQLSATSLRLEPLESATIFYKVQADQAPVWMTIYASFMAVKPSPGLNVRIMLPHTIYVYQHDTLEQDSLEVEYARYDAAQHRVLCELTNRSDRAGRAESVEVHGEHSDASDSGFPMLPHERRRLSIEWTSAHVPKTIDIEFAKFSLKVPVEEAANVVAEVEGSR